MITKSTGAPLRSRPRLLALLLPPLDARWRASIDALYQVPTHRPTLQLRVTNARGPPVSVLSVALKGTLSVWIDRLIVVWMGCETGAWARENIIEASPLFFLLSIIIR